jgi:hypothetical protein
MITVLSPERKLQPYSVILAAFDLERLKALPKQNGTVFIEDASGGKTAGGTDADITITVTDSTEIIDLSVPVLPGKARAERIRNYLAKRADDYGISALAYGGTPNEFCRFLEPRLTAFRFAAIRGDAAALALAAANMAGCGVGLTPSSDDLLSGYLAALSASGTTRDLISIAACSAAKKTNDISAGILKRAGEGLASEPVLSLLTALYGTSEERTDECVREAAKLGGSSGLDILTGIYFGVTDAALKRRDEIDQA